jgi:hypothetical protein
VGVLQTNSSGNIGIGTSEPVGTLHLKQAGAKLYIEDTSVTGSGIYFNANGGSSWVAGFASYKLINGFEFYAGNITTPKMVLVDTGNVGIGTSAPLAKLEMVGAGTTSATSSLIIRDSNKVAKVAVLDNGNVGIGTTNPRYTLDVKGFLRTSSGYIADGGAGLESQYVISPWGSTYVKILLGATSDNSKDMSIILNDIERVRFDPNGNVGIGTFAPVTKLHIGDAGAVPNAMSITGNDLFVKGNIEFDGKIYGDGSQLTNLASSQWTTSGSNIYYNTGNVGIGSASPVYPLDIYGANPRVNSRRSTAAGNYASFLASSDTSGYPRAAFFVGDASGDSINNAGFVVAPDVSGSVYRNAFLEVKTNPVNTASTNRFFMYQSTTLAQFISSTNDGNSIGTPMVFSTQGLAYAVPAIYIGSSAAQNVGIGTSVPLAKFDLVGAGTTSATSSLVIRDSAKAAKVTVLDNGNVGIGTTAPGQLLHVVGSAGASGFTGIKVIDKQHSMSLLFGASNSGDNSYTEPGIWMGPYADSPDHSNYIFNLDSNDTVFNAPAGGRLWFRSSNATKMAVLSTGNVGIGSTAPVARLDVVGAGTTSATSSLIIRDSNNAARVTVLDNGNVGIGSTNPIAALNILSAGNAINANGFVVDLNGNFSANYVGVGLGVNFENLASPSMQILRSGSAASANMTFTTGGAGTAVERMRITSGGNIGIGTTAPVKKLEVMGGDVYINQTSSQLIMKKPDGTCASCGPNNSDIWVCTGITCP